MAFEDKKNTLDKMIDEFSDEFLNEYEILETMGKGGFGIVYKVQEKSIPNRYFALKILKDAKNISQFEEEVKLLDELDSCGNILKLASARECKNGLYILTKYQNGGNLFEFIKENGILDENKTINLLEQLLNALECAHNKNIIHKDIKPENILLHKADDVIEYVLADWGLSGIKDNLSHSTGFKGTLLYSPPEKFNNKRYFSSDIYSLGCTLYYAITGKFPYGLKINSTSEAKINAHLNEKIDLSDINSDKLKSILEVMFHKEPKERAYINDLRELIKGSNSNKKDTRGSIEFNDNLLLEFIKEDDKEKELKKPKIKKSKSILAISIVVSGVILGGLYWFYFNSKNNKEVEEKDIKPIPTVILKKEPKVIIPIPTIEEKYNLNIEVTPKDSIIYINDKKYVNGVKLKKGEYKIKILKNGYKDLEEIINLSEDKKYQFKLEEILYSLVVKREPKNATVKIMNIRPKYYDGIELKSGKYRIKVSKDGYKSVDEWIKIDSNKTLNYELKEIKYTLNIKVNPFNANIKVQGVDNYYNGMKLKEGIYYIKISKDGYLTKKYRIELKSDTHFGITLIPKDYIEPEMIYIEGGSFMMGSNTRDDEEPIHKVNINYNFYIGKYEVTHREFLKFINDKREGSTNWFETKSENSNSHIKGSFPNYYIEDGYENHPMIEVTWYGAKAYTEWLSEKSGESYRLPTEAEWEYVARAGTTTKWSFGNDESKLYKYANYYEDGKKDGYKYTSPVGSFKPNPWGVYDIHGNVYEWCEDWYVDNYNSTPRDGNANVSGEQKYKVLRGSSFDDLSIETRSAYRGSDYPTVEKHFFGFRLLKTLK